MSIDNLFDGFEPDNIIGPDGKKILEPETPVTQTTTENQDKSKNVVEQPTTQTTQSNHERHINDVKIKKESVDESAQESEVDLAINALQSAFDIEETNIEVPGLKTEVVITPLVNDDEIVLGTNKMTLEQFVRKLNTIILEHVKTDLVSDYVREGLQDSIHKIFNDLKSFEKNILNIDRLMLIYGLAKISFNKFTEFPMVCEKCEKEYIADFDIKNIDFNFKDPEKVLKTDYYTYSVTQSFAKNLIEIDFGFTPEFVRLELLKEVSRDEIDENLAETNGLMNILQNLINYIKEVRVYTMDKRKKDGRRFLTSFTTKDIEGIQAIKTFFKKLPLKIKETIFKKQI